MNTGGEAAVIYTGSVMHRRCAPHGYRFSYPVFSLLLDIDRLQVLAGHSRLFAHNRFNLFAFHDRDHGPGDGSALRPWLERHLRRHGVELDGGRIRLLCFPRLLGYAFNPLSIWYCWHRDGRLRAVLCEVSNTFGERHGYLLHGEGGVLTWPVRAGQAKCFHVSPFLPMDLDYRFRLSRPGERLGIAIHCLEDHTLKMAAAQVATAQPFNDRNLLLTFLRMPLMTFKVVAMIHWQALKLLLRRAPLFRKPEPPAKEVTPCSAST
jgi:DUF1365 family protein